MALIIVGPVVLYLLWEATRGSWEEAGRMIVILVLCTFSTMFWGFFELAGSTITRFTEEVVNRHILGTEVQSAFLANVVNPLLIIGMSIPAAAVWVWLDRRRLEPSSPFKFVMGLGFLSLGFVMLLLGAKEAQGTDTGKCAMLWLILAFFFHTTGELCLSPVGLSTITKLSPARLVGMFMGVWFLSSALGNVLAPWVAGSAAGGDFDDVFTRIALITAAGGAVLLFLVPKLTRMMHGVK
jgi:POT family proton-dependent oligopeptide transporter